jgi:RNA polymerase sigma factor (sigma-70 family)
MHLDAQIPHSQETEFTNPAEEAETLKKIANGDKDLYAWIIRRYNQRLYRIAMSIVGDEFEVQDIMQTTYLKAYENLNQFKFQSSFSTWITRILLNEAYLLLRKRKQALNMKKIQLSMTPAETQTPLTNSINAELRNMLESSIRNLPEKLRTVFVMRELESMSIADTMACLDLSESNVKIRLNRAKVILRKQLGEYLKDDDILKFHKPYCDKMVSLVMGKLNTETEK